MKANVSNIAGRLEEFLRRQCDAIEAMRAELADFSARLEEPDDSALVEGQKLRETLLASLAEEHALLKREWDETEGLSAHERARVNALSERVGALIAATQPLLAASAKLTRARMEHMTEAMNTLRRGKQVLQAYKSASGDAGGGLDRNG